MLATRGTRRSFIGSISGGGAAFAVSRLGLAQAAFDSPSTSMGSGIGVIGIRYQGAVIAGLAKAHGRLVGIVIVSILPSSTRA
jgi:hypothetical protein